MDSAANLKDVRIPVIIMEVAGTCLPMAYRTFPAGKAGASVDRSVVIPQSRNHTK